MSPSKKSTNKIALPTLIIFVVLTVLTSPYAGAAGDGKSFKFKDGSDEKLPERYTLDKTTDSMENIRVINLLKQYVKEYTPIPVSDDTENTLELTVGARNWHISYGRKYFLSGYETAVSLYLNQSRNDLDDYKLAIQNNNLNTPNKVYDDLKYTLTSAGISGSLYYFSTENKTFSLGLELALLGLSRLSIESEKAKKSYSSNGLALLGYPVWRHTSLIPLKIRYQPSNNFAMLLSLHYSYYGIWQETTRAQRESANTPGEWFQGCNAELCNESDVFPAIGVQVIF